MAEEEITIGDGEYFVLGDNRNQSEDSRNADIGNVKKEDIYGKAWFVCLPWENFGQVPKGIHKERTDEHTVVPGTYDEGPANDAGKYQADRPDYRAGGCESTAVQQKSGY